ncbi:MAG TPA: TetR family transcriptional regulator [Candidatus Dormibacteraeota bacterium]
MAAEPGLRERKKRQTRELIADAARGLFAERGFDAVTVAQVARAANVSEVTVFNYFPTKEDLFYGGMQFFEERLLDAVRERAPGTSVLEAFRRPVMDGMPRLASDEAADAIAAAGNLISASPALEAHERTIVARYTRRLAELLAAEAGAEPDDIEAIGVASALMGVQRAVVGYVRKNVLAGRRGPGLVKQVSSQAVRAFGRLEGGLGDYGTKSLR